MFGALSKRGTSALFNLTFHCGLSGLFGGNKIEIQPGKTTLQ
jgi:hypothetical protein